MALDGIRMPDGCYADGTWELKMHVTDLHRDVSLRVTGEIHIGGVMLKLVEKLGEPWLCVIKLVKRSLGVYMCYTIQTVHVTFAS
uniref:Kindlin-2 N-terminal domain-containing protein n=1 Tax=Hippocampus comes TaxID=109280 RepID=A0A3Q2YTL8_HIPCM